MRNHWILGALAESYAQEEKEDAMAVKQPKFQYTVLAEAANGDRGEVDYESLAEARKQATQWIAGGWFKRVWVTVNSRTVILDLKEGSKEES